jgi:hypothetical protein
MTIDRPRLLLAVGTAACLGGALSPARVVFSISRRVAKLPLSSSATSSAASRTSRLDRLDPTYPHCF